MGDGSGHATADDDRLASESRTTATGTPRWVKISAAIALAVVLLIVAMVVLGGGAHGPGRHLGGGDPAAGNAPDHEPPTDVPEGHEPPSWVPEH